MVRPCAPSLFLGEVDLHGGGGGDLEPLERVPGRRRLHLRLELHERDVVTPGDQADLGMYRSIRYSSNILRENSPP